MVSSWYIRRAVVILLGSGNVRESHAFSTGLNATFRCTWVTRQLSCSIDPKFVRIDGKVLGKNKRYTVRCGLTAVCKARHGYLLREVGDGSGREYGGNPDLEGILRKMNGGLAGIMMQTVPKFIIVNTTMTY